MTRFSKALFALGLVVSMTCGAAESETAAATPKILVLNMRLSAGQHEVRGARIVDSAMPSSQRRPKGAVISYALTDASDQLLVSGITKDPRVLRGPMPAPGAAGAGHFTGQLDDVEYVLRVPYTSAARYLKFSPSESAAAASKSDVSVDVRASSVTANEAATQVIDLQQYLPRD